MNRDGRITANLMHAAYDVFKRDVGLGLLTPEDMRLSINSRRGLVLELTANGMSQRAIAKLTGVSQSQVERDLNGRKATPKGSKSDPKGVKTGTIVKVPDPESEELEEEHPALTPEELWYNSFRHHAGEAIAMTSYWNREFGEFLKFPITSELVTLAKQAAKEWTKLANNLKELSHETEAKADARSS